MSSSIHAIIRRKVCYVPAQYFQIRSSCSLFLIWYLSRREVSSSEFKSGLLVKFALKNCRPHKPAMANTINFPDTASFIDDLILQRTTPFIRLGGGAALSQWFATGGKSQLSGFLYQNRLLDVYLKETLDEVCRDVDALIQIATGMSFDHIVSIGPGNGLVELLLYRQKAYSELLLIDIEYSDLHKHGYAQQGSGYASLANTRQFLVENGIPAEAILTCNPQKQALPDFGFDLLFSVLSMGFHYPCDGYVDFIRRRIKPNGSVVFDKRKGTFDAGFDTLMRELRCEMRMDSPRVERVLLRNHKD